MNTPRDAETEEREDERESKRDADSIISYNDDTLSLE